MRWVINRGGWGGRWIKEQLLLLPKVVTGCYGIISGSTQVTPLLCGGNIWSALWGRTRNLGEGPGSALLWFLKKPCRLWKSLGQLGDPGRAGAVRWSRSRAFLAATDNTRKVRGHNQLCGEIPLVTLYMGWDRLVEGDHHIKLVCSAQSWDSHSQSCGWQADGIYTRVQTQIQLPQRTVLGVHSIPALPLGAARILYLT